VYWSATFTSKFSSPLDSIEKRFMLSRKFYKANSTPPPPFLAKLTISKLTNSRGLLLDAWNHFKRQKLDGKWKTICNYCAKSLLGDAKHGTSHLRSHFESCKLQTTRDIKQSFLKTHKEGGETVVVGNYVFNQQTARDALRVQCQWLII